MLHAVILVLWHLIMVEVINAIKREIRRYSKDPECLLKLKSPGDIRKFSNESLYQQLLVKCPKLAVYCFHLPARQLKRKYATPQRCRNYKSIQECSEHGDIHLFASVQPTAECHSLQDESSSQWWSQGTDARTWLTSWHLHVTPLSHQDS